VSTKRVVPRKEPTLSRYHPQGCVDHVRNPEMDNLTKDET